MVTVLIVDDSRTSRRFLRNMLTEAGYEVVAEAVDGEDGMKKYEEFKPDIVTMDITMPKLDGIDAVSEILKINPAAKKFDTLSIQEVVDRKLGVIDMTASVMCMENRMPIVIFGLNKENSIVDTVAGKIDGTVVTA